MYRLPVLWSQSHSATISILFLLPSFCTDTSGWKVGGGYICLYKPLCVPSVAYLSTPVIPVSAVGGKAIGHMLRLYRIRHVDSNTVAPM